LVLVFLQVDYLLVRLQLGLQLLVHLLHHLLVEDFL
jgi:hypothetical protein